MMDTKHPSPAPGWKPTSLSYPTFLKRLTTSATSWFATMRGLVSVEVEDEDASLDSLPEIVSPWDRLVTRSLVPHSVAVSTAEKPSQTKGSLMNSLLEFAPRFKKYYLAKQGRWVGFHRQGPIGLIDKQPPFFLSKTEAASSTFRCPPVVITVSPAIILPSGVPTVVVTDVDGPMPNGTGHSLKDEAYRAMSSGEGLLWSGWSGRFSLNRCRCGIECGDAVYFEDQEDEEVEVEDYTEDYFREDINQDIEGRSDISTCILEKPRMIAQEPKELEWWEIEGDDENGSINDESGSDLEDDDDDSDDNDDEDEDEDQEFSDSEDGDDEHEDDSDGDDSGEDSDIGEEPEGSDVFLALSNYLSDLGTSVPSPSQTKSHSPTITYSYTKGAGLHEQDSKNIEENSDTRLSPSSSPPSPSPSCPDSDFESYNSCTTISSLSPTPATPSSPCVPPIGDFNHIEGKRGCPAVDCMIELWWLQKDPWQIMVYLDLELGASRGAVWDLEPGGQPGLGETSAGKTLSIEALDLARQSP